MSLKKGCPVNHNVTFHFDIDLKRSKFFSFQPEKNISTDPEQTEFVTCKIEEAEIYSVYGFDYAGESTLLADCCCRKSAIQTQDLLRAKKSTDNFFYKPL